MRKHLYIFTIVLLSAFSSVKAQFSNLEKAVETLQADWQMKHAILGFSVIDLTTGKTVFDVNESYGLAPASALKVMTAIAAYDLLQPGFTFSTRISIEGTIKNGVLDGNVAIAAAGDPSLGSWRYKSHPAEGIIDSIYKALDKLGVKEVRGALRLYESTFETQTIPPGWTWEDMGNYYGAGAAGLNWNENQYDLYFSPATKGNETSIVETVPPLRNIKLVSEVSVHAGNEDNAFIFLPPYASTGYVRGSIPANKRFKISGSVPDPVDNALFQITSGLEKRGIAFRKEQSTNISNRKELFTFKSPVLDSINYWFLQKSINLYGEALVKQMAFQQTISGETETGLKIINEHWRQRGIPTAELRMLDGSGLSPANRVTSRALASAMVYAKKQLWYSSFYHALPTFNKLKMESGTIGGVKSFVGYKGKYAFAIIINNYSGTAGALVPKMYKVLDHIP